VGRKGVYGGHHRGVRLDLLRGDPAQHLEGCLPGGTDTAFCRDRSPRFTVAALCPQRHDQIGHPLVRLGQFRGVHRHRIRDDRMRGEGKGHPPCRRQAVIAGGLSGQAVPEGFGLRGGGGGRPSDWPSD
jgi:hypothetical protein